MSLLAVAILFELKGENDNLILIKIGQFFVRSLPTRAATDCGQLFMIVNCRVWKETVRLLFTFTCEMAKFRKYPVLAYEPPCLVYGRILTGI